jgi:Tfp pilus assembly protein PilE
MELLVVVLLIAILAAMATPQYMKVVEKQKGTDAVNLLATIGKSQERYFAVNEKYTNDFSDLDSDLVDYNSNAAATGPTYYSIPFFYHYQFEKLHF